MMGMDKETGKWMDGDKHLRQSLQTLVTTNKGERVMRRNIGLDLDIVDKIHKGGEDGELAYAIASALDEANETRLELREAHFKHNAPSEGKFDVKIHFESEQQISVLDASVQPQ